MPNLVPKLTLEKYREFEATQKPNWAQSINYLHKGYNSTFDSCGDASYAEKSFIDLAQAITKWRNEAPDLPAGSLVLLMGTEAAPDDKGSLKDTSFVISPRELIHWLQNDYSEWFASVLSENSIDGDDARRSIHTLYRAIFKSVNINIFKLSEFIDELSLMQFSSIQDLLGYICETLNTTWGIPSVMDPKYVPRANKLAKGRLVDAKIITNGINFKLSRFYQMQLDESISLHIVVIRDAIQAAINEISHLPKDIDGLAQFIKQFNKTANEHCWKTILACATATKEGLESEQAKWMQKYVIVAEASYKTMSQHECAAWLDRTRTYPDYFTEEAIKRFNEVKELVESRLHRSRVEAIISMYDALTENEKAEFKRLMDRK